MDSGEIKKTSLLLVIAKFSQPVEVILMWVEARFGVHPLPPSARLKLLDAS
jgi:hypothetical protein